MSNSTIFASSPIKGLRTPERRHLTLSASAPNTPRPKRLRLSHSTSDIQGPSPSLHRVLLFDDMAPYKPCAEEQAEYYYGLAHKPRLVARSSSFHWSKPEDDSSFCWGPKKKIYAPIRDYEEVAARWTKTLSQELAKVLNAIAWNFLVPIKIGIEDELERGFPIILLVGVAAGSIDWDTGVALALECRSKLQAAKIYDVDVELAELARGPQMLSTNLESLVTSRTWGCWSKRQTNKAVLPLLSTLGLPVASDAQGSTQGSLGLYLKLGGDKDATEKVYALTCRHVVSGGRSPEESYKASDTQDPLQYHIQASDITFDACISTLEALQDTFDSDLKRLQAKKQMWEEWYSSMDHREHLRPTTQEEKRLETLVPAVQYNREILEECNKMNNRSLRRIGHLAFCPTLGLSKKTPGYLTDWALICMDLDKFPKGTDNKVLIEPHVQDRFTGDLEGNLLQLKLADYDLASEKSYEVAKRGPTTELTMGIKSAIKAVVRTPNVDQEWLTWEMIVLPPKEEIRKGNKFSAKGDSGSAVFNTKGEIVGMITASTAQPSSVWRGVPGSPRTLKEHPGGSILPQDAAEGRDLPTWPSGSDITFVTPFDWILPEIEEHTGLKATLV